jgi:putative transposase
MRLVEQHRIDAHDPRFAAIDAAAFASKHLYNAALYATRQAYIHQRRIITFGELARDLKTSAEYRALPAKVAQWVLRQVALAWKSYFAACAAWQADPSRFLGHPKLPKYLAKQGRNLLTYTEQAISHAPKHRGYVVPSGLDIRLETRQTTIDQVRIVPHATHYTVEVIYERPVTLADVDPARIAAIDVGLNNLAAVTANQHGLAPLLVNGRPLKALNQWYNKRRAQVLAKLPAGVFVSRQLDTLADKRARQPSPRGLAGGAAHRHAGHWQERWLETSDWPGEADQSELRVCAACALPRDADLQGRIGGHRRTDH